eukprot:TRINITY_DN29704_c0_g1_i1.p1 TRINITY_DN29704_c0_g1~~TRINITY_DN29704_c0_g1_i1.p1  ORF type:complete len:431 (+),score=56.50 TRINITY_DN29704_c0_g1_i1:61-1353(+)
MLQLLRTLTRNRAVSRTTAQLRCSVGGAAAAATHYADALRGVPSPPLLGQDGIVQVDPSKKPCHALPALAYTSDAIFQEEQESVFADCWNYVGHASQLPSAGSYTTSRIGTEELLLVRDKDGTIRAFYNVCSHRAHRMVEPGTSGSRPVLICPNHAWTFKLDGTLHKARKTSGQAPFDPVEWGLKQVQLEQFNGVLFCNLSKEAPPLWADSPGLREKISEHIISMQDMKLEATVEKEVNSNWKCLVDNFLECYHCDTAHKDFVDMVDMSKYESHVRAYHVYNHSPCNPNNSAYSFSKDDPCQSIHYYWLWPNTVIYSAPGPPNMSVLQFIPVSAHRSIRRAHRFFAHSEAGKSSTSGDTDAEAKAREAAVQYLNDVLLNEDTKLCESMQQGMMSKGFQQGRLSLSATGSWETEKSLAQFHALVHSRLTRT